MLKLPDISEWSLTRWGLTVLVLMVLTLAPGVWTQWRQLELLDDERNHLAEQMMWLTFELERDLHGLSTQLRELQDHPSEAAGPLLRRQFDGFADRVRQLQALPASQWLADTPVYATATQALSGFVERQGGAFAQAERLAADGAQLETMQRAVQPLGPQLVELARETNRLVARQDDDRTAQLRDQSLLVIGMAVLHSLIMLTLLGLLLRHIRRQQQQYNELRVLSQQLATARDEAEAANQGKSIFLANMSHEVRTPFQGLLGMLNLLEQTPLSGHQRDYLQTAQDSAVHLLGVLNDILDVSTMESGTLKLSVAPVHLRSLVQEVEDLMRVAAHDKGLELSVYAAADLPNWVQADATRVRQILFNLLSNAIKFTQQGRVVAEITRGAGDKDEIVMTVRDTGPGMDADTVQRLFTRFYQADSTLRRRTGGAGLGLEISRKLARLMGGDIEVSSELGVGSVFVARLHLPLAEVPQSSADADALETPSVRRLRLLVAEDHAINLKYMSILLEKMGHDATFCENGQEALELLKHQVYDAVLLDYHMPVLDGMATTEAIRALPGPAGQVPVILVTADVVNDTRKRALECGVNEFTSKPLKEADLQRALKRCGLLDEPAPIGAEAPTSPATPPRTKELSMTLNPPAPAPEVVLDIASYEEILSLMPQESLDDLLKTLFDPPGGTVHELLTAFETGTRKLIGDTAHKLKGTCLLLGFKLLGTTAARIEHLALRTEETLEQALMEAIRQDTERTRQALREYKQANGAA